METSEAFSAQLCTETVAVQFVEMPRGGGVVSAAVVQTWQWPKSYYCRHVLMRGEKQINENEEWLL